jgi:uncharacterized membrane protein YgcG
MLTRHCFLYAVRLVVVGGWLGLTWGCSPEYELLRSDEPQLSGGSVASGGSGSATAVSGAGGSSGAGGAQLIAEGGESSVGGYEAAGSAP